jgi:two-component system nitrate/nitrite response regulator NarL
MSLQAVSPRNVSSIIVEPRVLVRDSLNSLVTSYSYRVIGSYASAFDIQESGDNSECDGPTLAIIGAQSIEQAIDEALRVRQVFAKSKVVVLLETVRAEDIQRMSEPTIDACIPLYASRDVLIRMLEVVTSGSARVVVLADAPYPAQATKSLRRAESGGPPQKQREVTDEDGTELSESRSASDASSHSGAQRDALALPLLASGSDEDEWDEHAHPASALEEAATNRPYANGTPFANGASTINRYAWNTEGPDTVQRRSCARNLRHNVVLGDNGLPPDPAKSTREPKISDRELQILDGLVKGHGNKMIARECAITEATVKVHMKSILRKICVANRTQAAIWALEHGYCTHLPETRKIEQAANGAATGAAMRPQDL